MKPSLSSANPMRYETLEEVNVAKKPTSMASENTNVFCAGPASTTRT